MQFGIERLNCSILVRYGINFGCQFLELCGNVGIHKADIDTQLTSKETRTLTLHYIQIGKSRFNDERVGAVADIRTQNHVLARCAKY